MNRTNKSNMTPTHYVGIGASAGGLEAIEAFFANMNPVNGLAFIVVQHLSPDYKSLMAELLSKKTEMTIFRAEEGMLVEKNSIYLIPPKKNLKIFHGKLLLSDQADHPRGINLPIDIFFNSLAEDQKEKAIGIILSGTGSDGTRGIRAIKENGGMIMVQDEASAKFDGMPRSAISTGLTDFIIPCEEMPEQLLSFTQYPYISKKEGSVTLLTEEDNVNKIFAMLRDKTKVDFTYYKHSTVLRRIERRMTVNQIHEFSEYAKFMENYPDEVNVLYRELLIGVTNFFRDTDAFEILSKKYLPELFSKKDQKEIRLWVAGCSTGEEAYTLAILCSECLRTLEKSIDIKIFATDLDRSALLKAGAGIYPASIVADVSSHLLSRYFIRKDDNFQVSRKIREMVVFAQHNLIKDPPFTNMDFISCRNLLIYLQPVLQRKALEFFNFSLKAGAILFLGSSETTGEMADFFEPINNKWKIYRSKGKRGIPGSGPDVSNPYTTHRQSGLVPVGGRNHQLRVHEDERTLERFLQTASDVYLPVSLIVNEQSEILHSVGDLSKFFILPSGKMTNDVIKMAIKELSMPLATGLQKVFHKGEDIIFSNIKLLQLNTPSIVKMQIKLMPEKKGQDRLAAVFIENVIVENKLDTKSSEQSNIDYGKMAEQRILDLEQELQFTKENLQATIEELETSNEELQSTNEELLASNEELQSTNEELQSVNEELHTVNIEYQSKIVELTELNNDLDNLLKSSNIGTIFLDENFEIRRFTHQVKNIFKIIDSDIGRPFHHINHDLIDINPVDLAQRVMESGHSEEIEVSDKLGKWYLFKISPYYIAPEAISGVVLTFVDSSKLKKAEETNRKLLRAMEQSPASIILTNTEGSIEYINPLFEESTGYSLSDVIGKNPRILKSGDLTQSNYTHLWNELEAGRIWKGEFHNKKKNGDIFWVKALIAPVFDENSIITNYLAMYLDITELKELGEDFNALLSEYDFLVNSNQFGYAILEKKHSNKDLGFDFIFLKANSKFSILLGLNSNQVVGKNWKETVQNEDELFQCLINSTEKLDVGSKSNSFKIKILNQSKTIGLTIFCAEFEKFYIIFDEIS